MFERSLFSVLLFSFLVFPLALDDVLLRSAVFIAMSFRLWRLSLLVLFDPLLDVPLRVDDQARSFLVISLLLSVDNLLVSPANQGNQDIEHHDT